MSGTTRMIVEVVCFVAVVSFMFAWATARAKHRYEKIQQWHQYQECLEKDVLNPGSYICVPPKFSMNSQK